MDILTSSSTKRAKLEVEMGYNDLGQNNLKVFTNGFVIEDLKPQYIISKM